MVKKFITTVIQVFEERNCTAPTTTDIGLDGVSLLSRSSRHKSGDVEDIILKKAQSYNQVQHSMLSHSCIHSQPVTRLQLHHPFRQVFEGLKLANGKTHAFRIATILHSYRSLKNERF